MSNKLAIDASLSSTGWAVLNENNDVINCGKICTKKNDKMDAIEDEDNRINFISKQLLSICLNNNVQARAVEEAQFMYKNSKTGMQLSRLRGGISVLLSLANIKIKYIPPTVIKKIITGSGNAEKEEVADAIIKRYKHNEIVRNIGPYSDKQTKKIEKTSDIYDAISIGLADNE